MVWENLRLDDANEPSMRSYFSKIGGQPVLMVNEGNDSTQTLASMEIAGGLEIFHTLLIYIKPWSQIYDEGGPAIRYMTYLSYLGTASSAERKFCTVIN